MNLQPTEPPKEMMKGHRRCMQVQCGFYQQGLCQSCEKGHNCSARPYEINESCSSCLACENRPGYLRFGDDELEKQMDENIKQPEGVILIYSNKPSPEHRRQEEDLIR